MKELPEWHSCKKKWLCGRESHLERFIYFFESVSNEKDFRALLKNAIIEERADAILGPNTEGTAAPSAEAQLPQSAPDAPPVQRGVSGEALEWLEKMTRGYFETNDKHPREILAALAHKGEDEKA